MLYLSLFFPKNCHPIPYTLHQKYHPWVYLYFPLISQIIIGVYFPLISQINTDLNNILSFTLYTLHLPPLSVFTVPSVGVSISH